MPEQQTFAHMHETLLGTYAPLAELPHGYLLSPANPRGEAYVRDLIADELAASRAPPFFHIGSDEPSDLGRGQAKRSWRPRRGPGVREARDRYRELRDRKAARRPMIWDDALARHPELFAELPKRWCS
jgi:hypothetical protein